MKDEAAIALGAGVFALAICLLVAFTGLASDRMEYDAFLRSQALVLSCRAERAKAAAPETVDEICGPFPKYEDFK